MKDQTPPGQRLGRYELRSQIGAGGMGEVFLAQDTRPVRLVALKLLPAQFVKDEERLHRFEKEAETAAKLTHPNVASIYEVGESDGIHFIAMEYVEGQTLRTHIGKLKLSEALEIATQVALALNAAHEAGIVHRDIKPENIMLRPDGYVKVLDFGLAKLTEPQTSLSDPDAQTKPLVLTDPGTVMGTVQYMSPEQAQGLKVDARSDIWSLGVVLYEMVTGRTPFEGQTKSHLIVSILEEEAPLLRAQRRDAPEALEWIIVKTLRKDREERYQTVKELLSDLKSLKRRLEFEAEMERSAQPISSAATELMSGEQAMASTLHAPISSTKEAVRPTSSAEYILSEVKRHRRGVIIALAALIIAASGAFLGLKYIGRNQPATDSAKPFSKTKVARLTNTGKASHAAISPDGKYVVHVLGGSGQQSLWLRHIATGSDKEIVPAAEGDLSQLIFSSDGNYVYYGRFTSGENVLYQVPVLGGPSRRLVNDIDTTVTFSPDGKRLAFIRGDPTRQEAWLIVTDADGTGEQKLVMHKQEDLFPGRAVGPAWGPAWSPGGEVIVFPLRQSDASANYRSLMAVRLSDGVEKQITSQRWSQIGAICWLPDGSGLIIVAAEQEAGASRQIWYVSYPDGETRKITNDLNHYRGLSLTADSTALVTVQTEQVSNIWSAPGGDASRAAPLTSHKFDGLLGISWTPDSRIVYTSRASGNTDIWMMNADGTASKQLTFNARANIRPSVCPDGRYIVFASNRTGADNIWRMDIDGSHPKQLTNSARNGRPLCSPDGQWVIYISSDSGQQRMWKVPIDGGTSVQLTDYTSAAMAISPDGEQIAGSYVDEQVTPRRQRFTVIPVEGGAPTKGFDFPQPFAQTIGWTVDGRALTYIETRAGVSNIWSQPLDGSPPKQLTDFKSDQIFGYAWSSDGKRLALARGNESSDVVLISNLR